MGYDPIPEEDERIGTLIVDAAFAVHTALGPGLQEIVYEVCFCHELSKRLGYLINFNVPLIKHGIKRIVL